LLKQTKIELKNTKEWLEIQQGKIKRMHKTRKTGKQTKDLADAVNFEAVEARIKKARKNYNKLLFGNNEIFTNDYFKAIRDGAKFTSTQHQKQIHNCIRLMRDIDNLRKNIAIRTGNRWQSPMD